MRNLSLIVTVLAVAVLAATPASAQEPDLEGTWDLTLTTFVSRITPEGSVGKGVAAPTCEHSGTADINQDGMTFDGTATLTKTSGGVECPDEMMADIVDGSTAMGVGGTLTSADFGTANFTGGEAKASGGPYTGTMTVTIGPFAGSSGNWTATVAAPVSIEIPTLGAFGLALLVLLVLAAGSLMLKRRASA